MSEITENIIQGFKERLEQHPVYEAVRRIEDLRCFMQHHVYSVWDFMSLIKFLQQAVAPSQYPWAPSGDAAARRFINELVLEEESDEAPTAAGGTPAMPAISNCTARPCVRWARMTGPRGNLSMR